MIRPAMDHGASSFVISPAITLDMIRVFAGWLVWLVATGVRLVRARTVDRPDDASTSDEEEG